MLSTSLNLRRLAVFFATTVSIIVSNEANAQVSINDNGAAANSNAILDIDISTNNKGLLIPRLTQTQIDAMDASFGATEDGMMVFNTDAKSFQYFVNGSGWLETGGEAKTTAPSATTDDITLGYVVGSIWNDVTNDKSYICLDNTDGAAVWKEITVIASSSLEDADSDTKIEVDNSDDDAIHFYDYDGTSSKEFFKMDNGRLEVLNTGNSVRIGYEAGLNDDLSGNRNIFLGNQAGRTNTTGQDNIAFGNQPLYYNTTGRDNYAIGNGALLKNTTGSNNIGFGVDANRENQTGGNNVMIGYQSGRNSGSVSGNVFLGHLSGTNETGSNKLYIENSNSATPLIYGEFDNDILTINGDIEAKDGASAGNISIYEASGSGTNKVTIQSQTMGADYTLTLPVDDGSANQVLSTDGSGSLSWVANSSSADEITDADNNTKVQVDEGDADENKIRFDIAGTEKWVMTGSRIEVLNSGQAVLIGEGAGANDDLSTNRTVAVGTNALATNATGNNNTGVGYRALANGDGMSNNTAIGYYPGEALTGAGATYNIAIGYEPMRLATTGTVNTAIGQSALYNNSGDYNTGIGGDALNDNTTGDYNTAVGYLAGDKVTTGGTNTFLGYNADAVAGTYTNATAIGANASVGQSNALILGNSADVGIGTSTPGAKLDVTGDIQMTSANARLRLMRTDGPNYLDYEDSNDLRIRSINTDDTNDNVRLVVEAGGNVGIGTSDATAKLDVAGDAKVSTDLYFGTAGAILDGDNQGGSIELGPTNSSGGEIPFLDFHYGVGSAQDFNYRIINSGNEILQFSSATQNTLTLNSASVDVRAPLNVSNGSTSAGSIAILEDSDDGTNKVTIQSQAMGADYTLTLPVDDGAANQVLTTDGSGGLSWTTTSGDGNGIYDGDGTAPAGTDVAITDHINFDSNTLYLDGSNNKVGVGTTTPFATFQVNNGAAPPTSGNLTSGIAVANGSVGASINMGVFDGGSAYGWIQAAYVNNAGIVQSLALNPLGGNVGIGTPTPATKLDVVGTIQTSNGSTSAGSIALLEDSDDGTNKVTIQSQAMGADYTLTLPVDDGTASQVLSTDGAGNLSWTGLGAAGGIYGGDGTAPAGTDVGVTDFINFDANTMYIDGTNDRVGIGTTTPLAALDIRGGNILVMDDSDWSSTNSRYIGRNQAGTYTTDAGFSGIELGGPASASEGYLAFHTHDGGTSSGEKMRIDKTGNVSIGNTSPTYKLDVTGDIRATSSFLFGTAGSALNTDQGGSMELGPTNSGSGEIPYIDFHYGVGSAQDFNTRIMNTADNILSFQTQSGAKMELTSNAVELSNGATSSGSIAILEDSDDGTNKVTIQSQAMGADYTLTLPTDDGAAGEQLRTDGSGNLSWGTGPQVFYTQGNGGNITESADIPTYDVHISQSITTVGANATVVINYASAIFSSGGCSGINMGGGIYIDGTAVITGNYASNNGNYATVSLPFNYSGTIASSGSHTIEVRMWKMTAGACDVVPYNNGSLVTTVYE